MRYALSLLLFALAPLLAAGEPSVSVTPLAGDAKAGETLDLRLSFTVSEGFYAYHKDNPGYGKVIEVTWMSLNGVTLRSETWPDPVKKVDDFSEEWALGGTFEILYKFDVLPETTGTVVISGSYDLQACDEEGCFPFDGTFAVSVEIEPGEKATEVPAEVKTDGGEVAPTKATAAFEAPLEPGGEARLGVTFTPPKGYHAYHPDSVKHGGVGMAPKVTFAPHPALTLKGEEWPEAKLVEYGEGWSELEYSGSFTVVYVFTVAADAATDAPLQADWVAQVCDDVCFDHRGAFSVDVDFKAVTSGPRLDKHGFYLDFDVALEEARNTGKLLLVDFNGDN